MNNFKTLGETTLEQKQDIWTNRMSGSQVKRVFSDALNLYKEKIGEKEPIDLSKTKVAERLEMGNIMEPIIVERAKDIFGLDIKVDKDTFESTDDEWFTANIDGYIGTDINNISEIIEIKNTTETNNEKLVSRYRLQIAYYMWFFNAKSAKLIALKNGHELEAIHIARDEEFELEMLNKLHNFKDAIVLGIPPTTQTKEEIEEKGRNIELTEETIKVEMKDSQEILNTFEELKEVNGEIKELKDKKETYEKILKKSSLMDFNKVEVTSGINKYQKLVSERKGAVDYGKMLAALGAKYGFDYLAELEKYRKKGSTTITFKITEVKND